jgi:hypothetical protein
MRCVKPLGQRLMGRDCCRQVAVLNPFTALGMPVAVAMG